MVSGFLLLCLYVWYYKSSLLIYPTSSSEIHFLGQSEHVTAKDLLIFSKDVFSVFYPYSFEVSSFNWLWEASFFADLLYRVYHITALVLVWTPIFYDHPSLWYRCQHIFNKTVSILMWHPFKFCFPSSENELCVISYVTHLRTSETRENVNKSKANIYLCGGIHARHLECTF